MHSGAAEQPARVTVPVLQEPNHACGEHFCGACDNRSIGWLRVATAQSAAAVASLHWEKTLPRMCVRDARLAASSFLLSSLNCGSQSTKHSANHALGYWNAVEDAQTDRVTQVTHDSSTAGDCTGSGH